MNPPDTDGGFRIADCGLPAWWRHLLVALATLILCSCQSLPPLNDRDPFADDESPPPNNGAVVTDRAGPQPTRAGAAPVEVRQLDPEVLKGSHPLELPMTPSRAGWGPSINCVPPGDAYADDQFEVAPAGCEDGALVGPSDEYLCDGGDFGLPAAVRADWTVDGLEQEDAVAHYDTVDGRVVVTPSNRVCVYAPRFAVVRRVENPQAHERRQLVDIAAEESAPAAAGESQPVATAIQRHAATIDLGRNPAHLFRARQQAGEAENLQAAMEAYVSLAAYANLEIIRTGELCGSEQAKLEKAVQSAVTWAGDQAVQVVFENKQAVAAVGIKQPGVVYQTEGPHSPWLRLIKLASTNHALPGEEVEFTLRFDNIGDQVIGNVTIVDNLATRLEYVPQSAKSSVAAGFSAVPNGAGSTVLRWEIGDPLKPGDGGILQFRVKVR